MQHRSESSLEDSPNTKQISPDTTDRAEPVYAEVAVPVHVSSTFTYRLPVSMQHLAQPGSRIVVPFGRKFVTGYIVALREGLRLGTSLQESDIKDAKELLDVIPLVTPNFSNSRAGSPNIIWLPWAR